MKYYFTAEKRIDFNAGTKAVNDTAQILKNVGYKPLPLGTCKGNTHHRIYKIYRMLVEWWHLLILLFTKSSKNTYFLQWPFYHIMYRTRNIVYQCIKYKCKHLQILIHDINSLRGYHKDREMESKFFSIAELIIVHTDKMKDYLLEIGVPEHKIKILTSFDYLTHDKLNTNRQNTNTIIYAGNLLKSPFLQQIGDFHGITVHCYGKEMPYSSPVLKYKGAFKSENVSVLEGSWGLVWDGISVDSCVGDFGDYLRYNAPHKLSLYIAAGVPVIIWKESGLAEYVVKKNLGIAVNSIVEIESIINKISTEKYDSILTCIRQESQEIRAGKHLLYCLS